MRHGRRRRRWAVIACVVASVIGLGAAITANAMAPPPNPPTCQLDPVTGTLNFPCVPAPVGPMLNGTATFTSSMSAAQQNATGIPGDPGATGTSSITINSTNNRLCATTSWSGIDSPVAAAHIHGGAAGQPENPAITIDLFPADFVNGKSSPQTGCTTVPAPELHLIKRCPAQFSTVVHSKNHPVGAIRGQVGTTCNLP
jgi:hypothetical protein